MDLKNKCLGDETDVQCLRSHRKCCEVYQRKSGGPFANSGGKPMYHMQMQGKVGAVQTNNLSISDGRVSCLKNYICKMLFQISIPVRWKRDDSISDL